MAAELKADNCSTILRLVFVMTVLCLLGVFIKILTPIGYSNQRTFIEIEYKELTCLFYCFYLIDFDRLIFFIYCISFSHPAAVFQ